MAIPSTTSLSSPSLRRPTWLRYPLFNRLRFIFEQANHTSIPTPVPLAHHSRKEPQCSTCTRGYANDDLRQPTSVRYPNVPRCLFNSCGKPEEGRYPRFARLPPHTLGCNHYRSDTQFLPVAPSVFQRKPDITRYPGSARLRCSLSEKSNWRCSTAIEYRPYGKLGVSDDHQY